MVSKPRGSQMEGMREQRRIHHRQRDSAFKSPIPTPVTSLLMWNLSQVNMKKINSMKQAPDEEALGMIPEETNKKKLFNF